MCINWKLKKIEFKWQEESSEKNNKLNLSDFIKLVINSKSSKNARINW